MRRWIVMLATTALGALAATAAVHAETVAVLGSGRTAAALGVQFARHGHVVVYGAREPGSESVRALVARTGHGARAATQEEAVGTASVVVLALPWGSVEGMVKRVALGDRVVIDASNALTHGASGHLEAAVDTSGAELLQQWAPQARVVKAFNAIGPQVIERPARAKGAVSVPIAGDDAAAKAQVARYVRSFGLDAIDVGPLRNARVLESLAILRAAPLVDDRRGDAFEYYFRRVAPARSR